MNTHTNTPHLIEPGVRWFLHSMLQKSHEINVNHTNFIMRIVLFVTFFVCIGGILAYRYRGQPTPDELAQKEIEQHQYILSKIASVKQYERQQSQQLITGLPDWKNDY
jgi:hypothetical protein